MSGEQNRDSLSVDDRARIVRFLVDSWEFAMASALSADGLAPGDAGSPVTQGSTARERILDSSGFALGLLRVQGQTEVARVIQASNAPKDAITRCLDRANQAGGLLPFAENQVDLLKAGAFIDSGCVGGLMVLAGGALSTLTGVGAVAGGFALVVGTVMVADAC